MRLDHIAYRVADRWKTANFFIDAFGYKVQEEFDIKFPNGETAKCIALEPPEKPPTGDLPWTTNYGLTNWGDEWKPTQYHMAPEIFVSDGTPESVVGKWVAARGGIGGVHHMAYQVESVQAKMDEWRAKGWGEFSSEAPMTCPGLTQVFSVPHALTGIIYEFIERSGQGFCKDNVKQLMESTERFS